MAIYRNLAELGNNILQEGDEVYLLGLQYRVTDDHLSLCNRCFQNDKIFSILNLNKYDFCKKHYGYISKWGSWPVCEKNDYLSLTRVVKALFEIIETTPKTINPEDIKPGDYVLLKTAEECVREGISLYDIPHEYYDKIYQVEKIVGDSIYLINSTLPLSLIFKIGAIKEIIKDPQIGIASKETKSDIGRYYPIDIEVTYTKEVEPDRIKSSSEFKFTINKPKKVFFTNLN